MEFYGIMGTAESNTQQVWKIEQNQAQVSVGSRAEQPGLHIIMAT